MKRKEETKKWKTKKNLSNYDTAVNALNGI